MIGLNERAKLARVPESEVAIDFVSANVSDKAIAAPREHALASIAARAGEHTALVLLSLLAAIALAVPLGIVAARRPRLGRFVVGAAGLMQTIPSLALLVLLIPLLGIGSPPVIAALFLYGLLPIVRNTHAGLVGIPEPLEVSARALGLPPGARLRLVELPLAMPYIVAGIKTSAVIAVGTATVGALVGAGGFGQPILTGIRLDDFGLILQGARPRRRDGDRPRGAARRGREARRPARPAPARLAAEVDERDLQVLRRDEARLLEHERARVDLAEAVEAHRRFLLRRVLDDAQQEPADRPLPVRAGLQDVVDLGDAALPFLHRLDQHRTDAVVRARESLARFLL
jgi:ABC-type proline/glycine betaine transport system permease subunit